MVLQYSLIMTDRSFVSPICKHNDNDAFKQQKSTVTYLHKK